MSDNDSKKKDDQNSLVNPATVSAAVAGAVVGAGVAVAGTIAMQNPENREKVKDAMGAVKDRASQYISNMEHQVEDKKEEITEKIEKDKK